MTSITCFDGVGCIGGNKILLEDGDKRLFFDFGTNFGDHGKYYEEMIRPKSCTGYFELLQMGLLPPFRDLYRDDLKPVLCDAWQGIEDRVIGEISGVVVSHAHVDHIGAIHYLQTDIPIICSPMTAAISRALQDSGKSSSEAEYCYYVDRVPNNYNALSMPNYRSSQAYYRKYYLSEPASNDLSNFWKEAPHSRELVPMALNTISDFAPFNLLSFPVDHSIFGATAWAVETDTGWVVYTGDIRMHGSQAECTKRFIEEAAKLKPVALIVEGTRIESDSKYTETDVKDACISAVKEAEGLVIADFGPRNVERLISFLEVAKETGRKLAILPKDAYLLKTMRMADNESVPSLPHDNLCIYKEYESTMSNWKKQIIESYSYEIVDTCEISKNQDKFICCFTFWDVQELAYIKPKPGSIWIHSSCEALNEEMEIDMKRLENWLDRFGVKFIGSHNQQDGARFHVSGHASREDLTTIVKGIEPKILIPVHSEHPSNYKSMVGNICDIRLPEIGVAIHL